MTTTQLARWTLSVLALTVAGCQTDSLLNFTPVEFDGTYQFVSQASNYSLTVKMKNGTVTQVQDGSEMKDVLGASPAQQYPKKLNYLGFTALFTPFDGRSNEQWLVYFTGDQLATGAFSGKLTFRLLTTGQTFAEYDCTFARIGN